jgi:hypothetical protein
MKRCQLYRPIEKDSTEKCPNCKRWNGKRCRDEQLLRELYEDSNEFKFFNRLMRENKGIIGSCD